MVLDDSLNVALGGGKRLKKVHAIGNNEIEVKLDPQDLELKPGQYNLTVSTSGGQATISNVIQVLS